MLYQLHEIQRAILTPFAAFADASAQMFSNPYSPLAYLPQARRLAAGYELLYRLGKHYDKPAWNLTETEVDGQRVAVLDEVVLEKPFCKLIHFKRALPAKAGHSPRVLVVAPLSGHHATLLRDTVRALLPAHDVYITDWIDARLVPLSAGPFHLDDYVHYVQDFLRLLGPRVHVMSVCQPTVPVLAAVSLMASAGEELPRSMIMMGGPIDTRRSPTQVNNLATEKPHDWFVKHLIYSVPGRYPGAGRRVYPGFLQHAGFVAMNPDRHMQSHWDYYENLLRGDGDDAEQHRRFYDEYNAVLDLPAEYYLDTIRVVFQEHQLPRGLWHVAGKPVRPQDIVGTALMTVEGELDDISGSGQTQAAHDLCASIPASDKQHFEVPGAGHYGIFSGKRWRSMVCPRITEFIRRYD
jgi:poly(3-hydroxybutyrate) depolymerase